MTSLSVIFLGTGAAMPISRGLPCIAVRIDSNIYLLDVGEGCQQRLFRMGLSPLKINSIMISHLHGDHYLGVLGLFQTMHLSGRKETLYIYAPRDFRELISKLAELRLLKIDFPIEIIDLGKGVKYSDNKVVIRAFLVSHGIEAYGFEISVRRPKVKIVYTGDTSPCENVVEHAYNADLLIHDATFTSDLAEEAHEQGHSTAKDAALVALKAGVDTLVLTHISARYDDPLELFYDAYRYFPRVIVAEDYMVVKY